MYKFVAILALAAVVSAAVVKRATDEVVPILRSESVVNPDGSYSYSFEGGDGSAREEKGTLMNAGTDEAYVAMVGSYKYIDAEGATIEVHYTADEKGFVPVGGNIPESISNAARAAADAKA